MKKIFAFLCAALLGIAAGLFCGAAFGITTVNDSTMEPNYLKGEHVLLHCGPGMHDSLQRGDVIIFENDLYQETGENSVMMKRIVGLPGELVEIEQGRLYVNGNSLPDSWTDTYHRGTDRMEAVIVPENSYFVLGDNRRQSTDSRDETVGMVGEDEIIGKVIRQW